MEKTCLINIETGPVWKTIMVARTRTEYWLDYDFSDPFVPASLDPASFGKEFSGVKNTRRLLKVDNRK